MDQNEFDLFSQSFDSWIDEACVTILSSPSEDSDDTPILTYKNVSNSQLNFKVCLNEVRFALSTSSNVVCF